MTLPRAVVVGYYGMSNFGDDLFAEVMRSAAAQLVPDHVVEVASGPRSLRRLMATDSAAGSMGRLTRGVVGVARSRVIVLGGGSVLARIAGVLRVQQALARFTGTRFQALGVSVGPFESRRDHDEVAAFLSKMDRVIVRDERSLHVAAEMGLGTRALMGGDFAALHAAASASVESTESPHPRAERTIGLALCKTDALTSDDLDALIERLADEVQASRAQGRPARVVVLVLNTHPVHGDHAVSDRAITQLRRRGIDVTTTVHSETDVDVIWSTIAALDAIVCVRLHAAITAYLTSVPFLMVEYHQKCTDFCDDVGQDRRLRIRADAVPGTVRGALTALLESPPAPRLPAARYIDRATDAYLRGAPA